MLVGFCFIAGCGGEHNAEISDFTGFSTFQIENTSNYLIVIDCESSNYSTHTPTSAEPGDVVSIGEFGEIGDVPLPEYIFDKATISYRQAQGMESQYVEALIVTPSSWQLATETENSRTYVYVVVDDQLIE